jgi:hypothetical protein
MVVGLYEPIVTESMGVLLGRLTRRRDEEALRSHQQEHGLPIWIIGH